MTNIIDPFQRPGRVLLCVSAALDADVITDLLTSMGALGIVCADLEELSRQVPQEADVAIVGEEMLNEHGLDLLIESLNRQPEWSDLPVLLVSSEDAESVISQRMMQSLSNVLFLNRPLHLNTLTSALRMALRAEVRQNHLRELLAERERREAALRENTRFTGKILSSSLNGLYIFDWNLQNITFANHQYTVLTGYTLDEIQRMVTENTFSHLFFPEDAGKIRSHIKEVGTFTEDETREVEYRFKRKDGQWRWFLAREALFSRNPDGSLHEYLGTFVDVTHRKEAEEALRESEKKFRTVFEQAAIGMGRVRFADTRWIEVNETFCRMLGYSPEEMSHIPWPEITHPEDVDPDLVSFRKMAAGELENYSLEKRFIHKQGYPVWARLTLSLVRDSRGLPDYEIAIIENITDKKMAEQALLESEEKFRKIFHTTTSVIAISTLRDGRYVDINEAFTRFTGYSRQEIIGRNARELRIWTDLEERKDLVALLERDRRIENEEVAIRIKSGDIRFTIMSATIMQISGEQYIVSSGLDITERKRIEEELLKARNEAFHRAAELDAALESLTEGIIFYDTDHSISHMNASAMNMLGFSPDDVKLPAEDRVKLFRLLTKDGEVPEKEELPGWRALQGEVVLGDELLVFPKGSDRPIYFLTSAAPIRMPDGAVIGAIQSLTDITQRKQMEKEILKNRDELELRVLERTDQLAGTNRALHEHVRKLEQLNQELMEFSHIASHDLQEPLRKIQTFGSRLEDQMDAFQPEIMENIRRMMRSAHRLSDLVKALRAYSEVNRENYDFKTADLGGVVREVLSDLEAAIQESGAQVKVETLPAIEADRPRIRRLFKNLIGNAIKYAKTGERPQVRVTGQIIDGVCRINVKDNGIGFDEKYLDRIFGPFQRLHNPDSPYAGTGMGLAICRKVVQMHNGTITAESTPGKGSNFIISIPASQSEGA